MKLNYTLNIIFIWFLLMELTHAQNSKSKSCLLHKAEYQAGDLIDIQSEGKINASDTLIVSYSYGATKIFPKLNTTNSSTFLLPDIISQRSGMIALQHMAQDHYCTSYLKIVPLADADNIETFVGPSSIIAGSNDFTMITVVPRDKYDNPLAEKSAIDILDFNNGSINSETVLLSKQIAYKKVYSSNTLGKIFLSANYKNAQSKEFEVEVLAGTPEAFNIYTNQLHPYADGNQIVTFYSDKILDSYGNIVADGTLVKFHVTTDDSNARFTQATTINGIAKAKFRHPDKGENWQITAYVAGITKSPVISLSFLDLSPSIEVNIDEKNRLLNTGPIQSFLKQLIPDGIKCEIIITAATSKETVTLSRYTRDGKIKLHFSEDQFPTGHYSYELVIGATRKNGAFKL